MRGNHPAFSLTVIATTGERFSDFAPYVASVNDEGTVAFQAALRGGGETIAETGDIFETLAFFPSANEAGTKAFAATLRAGGAGIYTVDEGQIVQVLDTEGAFESCRGALISSAGAVVSIATPRGEGLGIFAGPDSGADRILALEDQLLGSSVVDFAANPVSINASGHVAVRATLADGRQLILRADPTR